MGLYLAPVNVYNAKLMKPVFLAQKFHRPPFIIVGPDGRKRISPIVFTPACQHLPAFHIIPPKTPEEWMGRWFTIDF